MTTNTQLVQALATVDAKTLTAVTQMTARLHTVPDLTTFPGLNPTDFGIDEESAEWDHFMQITERFDIRDPDATHTVISRRLGEFVDAINTALAGGAR